MGRRKRSAGKLMAWPAGMSLARWRLHAKACLAAQSSATGLAKPDTGGAGQLPGCSTAGYAQARAAMRGEHRGRGRGRVDASAYQR